MMTVHVLHAGDGYQYLIRQVAVDDGQRVGRDPLTDYYLAEGNPPGQWVGTAIAELGVSGEVTEAQMQALFGEGLHPDADNLIKASIADGKTFQQAVADARLGRRFAQYDKNIPLVKELTAAYGRFQEQHGRRPTIVERRLLKQNTAGTLLALANPDKQWTDAEIDAYITDQLGKARQPVAGFDLVFTPTKGVSVLWALGGHEIRTAIEQAHEAAWKSTLAFIEREGAFTRVGQAGIAQIETSGLVAVAFTHRDSRAGDPNLHTHVTVSNRVRAADGKWRTLDSRQIHRIGVSASEHYNAAMEREVDRRVDVTWVDVDKGPNKRAVRDIAGLPQEWIRGFSTRRAQVESTYDTLVAQYVAQYGATPPRTVQLKLAQQATLTDRPGKGPLKTLRQQIVEWTDRARHMRPDLHIPTVIRSVTSQRAHGVDAADVDVNAVAATAVEVVSTNRAAWTVYHLRPEVERQLRGVRADSEAQHEQLVQAITDRALRYDSIRLDLDIEQMPSLLTRSNGESVFRRRGYARHTSQDILDAEQRLVDTTAIRRGPVVSDTALDTALRTLQRKTKVELNAGQRDLVRQFVTSGRALGVAIGPPGSGKSTAMRAVRAAWETTGGRVVGIAPSAAAAGVLGDELGIPADTIHSLVVAHANGIDVDVRSGDMLLVDEAGLAGTRMLDDLRAIAEERGAILRLVGDHRQLSAIESGGALRLVFTEAGGTELTEIRRFADPTEAEAVLKVRVGDVSAVDWYADRNRLHGGVKAAVLDQLYTAWQADQKTLRTAKKKDRRVSIMAADGNDVVAELSARAQRDLRAEGRVEVVGVSLRDGNQAGRGDTIVTRLNDRRMRVRMTDYVKNGDLWKVIKRHDDGRLRVQHLKHGGKITLPTRYVRDHVELGYAATVNRTQGLTTGIIRAFLSLRTTREALLVALSRGTHANHAYFDTDEILALDEPDMLPGDVFYRHRNDAGLRAAFTKILRNEGTELSGTETMRDALELPFRLQQQVPEYDHARILYLGKEATELAEQWVRDAVPNLADDVLTDESWPALHTVLREVYDLGQDPVEVLATLAAERELDTAESPAKVLHYRVTGDLAGIDLELGSELDREYRALLEAEEALGWSEPGTALAVDDVLRGDLIAEPGIQSDPAMRSLFDLALDLDTPIDAEIVPDPGVARAAAKVNGTPDAHEPQPGERRVTASDNDGAEAEHRSVTMPLAHQGPARAEDASSPLAEAVAVPYTTSEFGFELTGDDDSHPISEPALDIADAEITEDITWADLARQEATRLKARREGWRPDELPGWVATPPPADDQVITADFADLRDWLRGKAESISDRVQALAWRQAADRSAWIEQLGPVPNDPLERDEWMRRAGQVAAFRERFEIPDSDFRLLGSAAVRGEQARARTWVYNFLNPAMPTGDEPVPVGTGHGGPKSPQPQPSRQPAVDPQRLFAAIRRSATEWLNTQAATWIREAIPPILAEKVVTETAWPVLAERLRAVEDTGADPASVLADVYAEREVDTAESIAEVLHYRLATAAAPVPDQRRATSAPISDSGRELRDRLAERGRAARAAPKDATRDAAPTELKVSDSSISRPVPISGTTEMRDGHLRPVPGPDFVRDLAAASAAYLDAIGIEQVSAPNVRDSNSGFFRLAALRERAARLRRQTKLSDKQKGKQAQTDTPRKIDPGQGPRIRP